MDRIQEARYDEAFKTARSLYNRFHKDPKKFPQEFCFAGWNFIALKDVFYYPDVMDGYSGFSFNLPVFEDKSDILEIGCGTGCVIASYYLRNKNKIRSLTAVDVNPEAVRNTRMNFEKYDIPADIITSDLFENIKPGSKFDLIFWNIPFFGVSGEEELTFLERSIADPNYQSLSRFVAESPGYLKKEGRILIGFSTSCGSLRRLQELAVRTGRHFELFWSGSGSSMYEEEMVFQLFELRALITGIDAYILV